MLAKITVTLEQDDQMGTNAAMDETVKLLAELDAMPMMKLVLSLECEEFIAESYRAKLRLALRRRPMGIKVKISTKTDEDVATEYVRKPTPMDDLLEPDDESALFPGQAKSGGEKVLDWLTEREERQ